jgi:hypothetical protein
MQGLHLFANMYMCMMNGLTWLTISIYALVCELIFDRSHDIQKVCPLSYRLVYPRPNVPSRYAAIPWTDGSS